MAGTILFLGGIFNIVDPFFGLTIYQWFWIMITFASICVWLAFRYGVWEKYRVLWGLYDAFKAMSNAVFIFNMNLQIELWSEARAKCIFDYSKNKYEGFSKEWLGFKGWIEKFLFNYATVYLDEDELNPLMAVIYKYGHRNMDKEIARKLQNNEWESKPTVTVGGTDSEIILDADNWTLRDPPSPQHKAVESFCEVWNEGNSTDQIHTYFKFQRYLNNGRIDLSKIPSLNGKIKQKIGVPWVRIDATFPVAIEDNEEAGARRQQAEDEMTADKNAINKFIPYILGGGLGFAILIYVVRVIVFLMNNKPPV